MFWSRSSRRSPAGALVRDALGLAGAFLTLEEDVCVDWELPAEFERFAASQRRASNDSRAPEERCVRPAAGPRVEAPPPPRAREHRVTREPGLLKPPPRRRVGAPPPRAHACLCPLPELRAPCAKRTGRR